MLIGPNLSGVRPGLQRMKITYDPEAEAMYIRLNDHQVHDTDAVTDDFILDFDSEGNVIGIGLLAASSQLTDPPKITWRSGSLLISSEMGAKGSGGAGGCGLQPGSARGVPSHPS